MAFFFLCQSSSELESSVSELLQSLDSVSDELALFFLCFLFSFLLFLSNDCTFRFFLVLVDPDNRFLFFPPDSISLLLLLERYLLFLDFLLTVAGEGDLDASDSLVDVSELLSSSE